MQLMNDSGRQTRLIQRVATLLLLLVSATSSTQAQTVAAAVPDFEPANAASSAALEAGGEGFRTLDSDIQDMKQVQLDAVDLQVCEDVRGCQHIITTLAGEAEDYVHADVQAE